MPRRGFIPKREVLPDPVYGTTVVTKLINQVMLDGKRGVAQAVCYDAFERIAQKTKAQSVVPQKEISPEVMLGVIGNAKMVLGMRLHTLIYAAKNIVPAIALDYDPKVSAVMETIEQKFVVNAADIDVRKLCSYADMIFEKHDEICSNLSEKSKQYKTLANKNVDMAFDLLK